MCWQFESWSNCVFSTLHNNSLPWHDYSSMEASFPNLIRSHLVLNRELLVSVRLYEMFANLSGSEKYRKRFETWDSCRVIML